MESYENYLKKLRESEQLEGSLKREAVDSDQEDGAEDNKRERGQTRKSIKREADESDEVGNEKKQKKFGDEFGAVQQDNMFANGGLSHFQTNSFQNTATQMMIYENLMKKNAAAVANAVQNFSNHHFQSSTPTF